MTQDEHERMLKKMGKSAWQLNGLVIYESMKVQWFITALIMLNFVIDVFGVRFTSVGFRLCCCQTTKAKPSLLGVNDWLPRQLRGSATTTRRARSLIIATS